MGSLTREEAIGINYLKWGCFPATISGSETEAREEANSGSLQVVSRDGVGDPDITRHFTLMLAIEITFAQLGNMFTHGSVW